MFYTYLLQSEIDNSYYVGFTKDIETRLKEHNLGKTKSLKSKLPFRLVYFEAYLEKRIAIKREIQLKKNRNEKQKILERIAW